MIIAFALSLLFTAILLAGVVAYAAGAVTLKDARTGYLGADWHRRQYRRAYLWFALAGGLWLVDVAVWFTTRR